MLNAHPDLTASVLIGLGWYYLLMFLMNLAWTVRSYRDDGGVFQRDPAGYWLGDLLVYPDDGLGLSLYIPA